MNIHEYQDALLEKTEDISPQLEKVRYQPWICKFCSHDVAYHICEYEHEPIYLMGHTNPHYVTIDNGKIRCTNYNCNCLHTYETFMKDNEETKRIMK